MSAALIDPEVKLEDRFLYFKSLDGGFNMAISLDHFTVGVEIQGFEKHRYFVLILRRIPVRGKDLREPRRIEVTKDVYELVGHLLSNRRFNALITAHKSPIKNDENRA